MYSGQKMIRRKKNVKKGIQFCLMVCGASGTGESRPRPCHLLRIAHRLIADCSSRPDHLRQHALRQAGAYPQGVRRPYYRACRGRCQDQARHRWYAYTPARQEFWPQSKSNRRVELELDEEGTRISLTIVDTPGFGDQIDNEARYACRKCIRQTEYLPANTTTL